jgi:F0F1-type ATP synthase membrane subunit c/vacuolar-type H+-ATPase subunit K
LLVDLFDEVLVSAATRSGLLFGVFAFFSNLGLGILLAVCTPLCGIVWGIGAGIAAVAWSDGDSSSRSPTRQGAIAGAIAGVGALFGVVIGLLLQFSVLGGQQAASQLSSDFYDQFGLDVPVTEFDSSLQWVGLSFTACCLGLINVVILAGAGALSAGIYGSRRGESPVSDGA